VRHNDWNNDGLHIVDIFLRWRLSEAKTTARITTKEYKSRHHRKYPQYPIARHLHKVILGQKVINGLNKTNVEENDINSDAPINHCSPRIIFCILLDK
jgi:hypothetical protein